MMLLDVVPIRLDPAPALLAPPPRSCALSNCPKPPSTLAPAPSPPLPFPAPRCATRTPPPAPRRSPQPPPPSSHALLQSAPASCAASWLDSWASLPNADTQNALPGDPACSALRSRSPGVLGVPHRAPSAA